MELGHLIRNKIEAKIRFQRTGNSKEQRQKIDTWKQKRIVNANQRRKIEQSFRRYGRKRTNEIAKALSRDISITRKLRNSFKRQRAKQTYSWIIFKNISNSKQLYK